MPLWALQFVQWTTSSVFRPSIQGIIWHVEKKKTFLKKKLRKKMDENLRKLHVQNKVAIT